ncbi:MAG: thioredoxin family protein [Bacteroidota bacterium]
MFFTAFLLALLVHASPGPASVAEDVTWASLPDAFAKAAATEQHVLIYVHAAWCGPCRQMEAAVFPEVAPLLARFAHAELDYADHESRLTLGDHTRSPFAWAQHFGAAGTPTFVLLEPDGTPITRVQGAQTTGAFALLLAYVATDAYQHTDFASYAEQTQATPPGG